jgi:DNA polymerase III delta subunit
MKFSEFRQYQQKGEHNVFAFICEDDFLVEESRPVWLRIFGSGWILEKYSAKEFDEISAGRLMDEARTPSLFTQNRVLIVTAAEKLKKARLEDLALLEAVRDSSLKIILASAERKSFSSGPKASPVIEIDALKPGEIARWLVDRYKVAPDVARHLVENVGTELYPLHSEMEKLRTYVGDERPIEIRDVDMLVLRSEQFGPFDLDDAVIARDYNKAVQVLGAMLDEGTEPLMLLARLVRVWRQLFVGKALVAQRSAKDVAIAVGSPVWKASDFVAGCKKFEWKQLATGFRELLNADRAFKSSTPNPEGYFDVMLWKLLAP